MKHELQAFLQKHDFVVVSSAGVAEFLKELREFADNLPEPIADNGIVADNCAVKPYDYVAEAKRATLQDLLRVHLTHGGPEKAEGEKIAGLVNAAFNALGNDSVSEELAAAQNTIRIIQEGVDLPGKAGIGVEVVELVNRLKSQPVNGEGIDLEAADFSDALMWMKEGKGVRRSMFQPGVYVRLVKSQGKAHRDCFVFMKAGYIIDHSWRPTQHDLMADDWSVTPIVP